MSAPSPEFQDSLSETVTTLCACWRLERKDGERLGFTDHDQVLSFNSLDFQPATGFTPSAAEKGLGFSVETMQLDGVLRDDRITSDDLLSGRYDGAILTTYLVNWERPSQRLISAVQHIKRIEIEGAAFRVELESQSADLLKMQGRFFRRRCDATLGDKRCGVDLDRSAFKATGVIDALQTRGTLTVSGLNASSDNWFTGGTLTMTSGALDGDVFPILAHQKTVTRVQLTVEFSGFKRPASGDTFRVVAGCDKSFATCKAKFQNHLNFQGFPHMPGNDAAYSYVKPDGDFDGKPVIP